MIQDLKTRLAKMPKKRREWLQRKEKERQESDAKAKAAADKYWAKWVDGKIRWIRKPKGFNEFDGDTYHLVR